MTLGGVSSLLLELCQHGLRFGDHPGIWRTDLRFQLVEEGPQVRSGHLMLEGPVDERTDASVTGELLRRYSRT